MRTRAERDAMTAEIGFAVLSGLLLAGLVGVLCASVIAILGLDGDTRDTVVESTFLVALGVLVWRVAAVLSASIASTPASIARTAATSADATNALPPRRVEPARASAPAVVMRRGLPGECRSIGPPGRARFEWGAYSPVHRFRPPTRLRHRAREDGGMVSTVLASLTVPWIPTAHRMDVLRCADLPEDYTVTTAFVLALDGLGRTLLTRVDRPGRGWEVPGGHLDPGETPAGAAARELAEEAGLRMPPERLTLLGGQRITLLDPPPADYRYPTRAFQAFYSVRLPDPGAPTRPDPASECDAAEWVEPAEVAARCRGAAWLALHATLLD
ncbi:DUF6332 family protein [Embleya scabrispora]|uniref:DUF6332 family protein n=1 Tax=Embleya scabrispora TaxID=159449 RepID=UPI00036D5CF9